MEIVFNDWCYNDLHKDLDKMSVLEISQKFKKLGEIADKHRIDYFRASGSMQKYLESEYERIDKEKVYVAVYLAEKMTAAEKT